MSRDHSDSRLDNASASPDDANPFELRWLAAYIGDAKGNATTAALIAGSTATGRALRVQGSRLKRRMRNPIRGILALHGQDMYTLIGKQVDALNAMRVSRMMVGEQLQTFTDIDFKTRFDAARYLLQLTGAEAIAKRLAAEEAGIITEELPNPLFSALAFEPDEGGGEAEDEGDEAEIEQDGLTVGQAEQMIREGNRRLKTLGYQIVPLASAKAGPPGEDA